MWLFDASWSGMDINENNLFVQRAMMLSFIVSYLVPDKFPSFPSGKTDARLGNSKIVLWCHHDMEIFSHCWHFMRRNHRWPVDSPHKGPVMQSFLVFFDDSLNKLLIKQLCCWWSKTPWHSCDVTLIILLVDPRWVIWVNLQGWMICGNLFVNYLEHMLVMAL